MNPLGNILSQPVIASIGWTIVHSLWQCLILGVIFGSLMYFLRKNSPGTRYLIGSCLLFLMILISLITFISVYNAELNSTNLQENTGWLQDRDQVDKGSMEILLTLKSHLNRYLPIIVSLWMLGILVFFFKFAGSIIYNQRLKVNHTKDIKGYWKERIRQLCLKIKLKKKITIKESKLTKTPLTIGHLKPIILLPIGFLSGMPKEQVESLIAHELAHIVRRDYIINLFQKVMEILYFYHPVIYWISNHLRNERENCCDDIAVEVVGDSLSYAKALTRIGEDLAKGSKKADLAMAVSRNSFKLLKRIRRLFNMTRKKSTFSEGFIGIFTLLLFAFALVMGISAASGLSPGESNLEFGEQTQIESKNMSEEKKKEQKSMLERYEELIAKKADLSKEEKRELEELAHKLKEIQEKKEKEKLVKLKTEYVKLKSRKNLSKEEKYKLEKLAAFFKQQEERLKSQALYAQYKALKNKEKGLSQKEADKLKKIERLLEIRKLEEEKKKQEELIKAYKTLKSREKDLSKAEKEKLEQVTIGLKKMKQQEQHQRQMVLYQKYMDLKSKRVKLTRQEAEKLKKLEIYLQELKRKEEKIKQLEIMEKKKQMEKIAQLYFKLSQKQGNLSQQEEAKLAKATIYMSEVKAKIKSMKIYLEKLEAKYRDYQKKGDKLTSKQKQEIDFIKLKMLELKGELAYFEKLSKK